MILDIKMLLFMITGLIILDKGWASAIESPAPEFFALCPVT